MNQKKVIQLFTLLTFTFIAGCERDNVSTEKPKETISLERAHEMYVAYQRKFNALTELRGGNEDASSGWHSIEFYKNYIAYLEEASKKVKMEVSGLRLYYVAYPDDEKSGEYRDYQTYILVPTYFDKKTNSHVAFDPLHIDERGNPLPIHEVITKGMSNRNTPMNLKSRELQSAETASSIANMAMMCRPNCPSSL
ncbi:hypothetical protein [Chryseosolibacter indicus]|uniref:Lipoprotein n=1 Tax=Chryseosolibacter indicus TaxID=2782351 RepID=A0ABS5VSU6_9BACT|nr:hypothetical protein [Chryseosolibacter indicus]MBT1704493.1 hypothetical protein [Chryseosolibacter indicus]